MKILILHGPNMNLLGLRSAKLGTNITLDKVNRSLRKEMKNSDVELKIFQTNDESKAVSFLNRNRNKAHGLIFSPGVWSHSGYMIQEVLNLIDLPFVTVHFGKTDGMILTPKKIIVNKNPVEAYLDGLKELLNCC